MLSMTCKDFAILLKPTITTWLWKKILILVGLNKYTYTYKGKDIYVYMLNLFNKYTRYDKIYILKILCLFKGVSSCPTLIRRVFWRAERFVRNGTWRYWSSCRRWLRSICKMKCPWFESCTLTKETYGKNKKKNSTPPKFSRERKNLIERLLKKALELETPS